MTRQDVPANKPGAGFERLLTSRETADRLRVSLLWLAKARMQGDGPPFVKFGRHYIHRQLSPSISVR